MKRSRQVFESHPHPLQLRKVIVPESEEDWIQIQESNAYNRDEDWFQQFTTPLSSSRRPLASVQVLTSLIGSQSQSTATSTINTTTTTTATTFNPLQAPIFQKFYQKTGFTGQPKGLLLSTEESSSLSNQDENGIQNDIDNPSFSSLTKGQHRRYLQLTGSQQTERRKEHERKELRTLTAMIKTEQATFRQALSTFYTTHKDRFRAGFQGQQHPANPFCRWASNHQKEINQEWQGDINLPMHFGKCFQILSFPSRYPKLLDVDALHFEVVQHDGNNDNETQGDMPASDLPQIGSQIKVPSTSIKSGSSTNSTRSWLKDDTVAMELAKEKGAIILTSVETLETLLQLPRDTRARWMLFATTTNNKDLTILDKPIAQPMMPRQCLELGLQEGIYHHDDGDKIKFKHVYTLWTLPATTAAMRRQPIRVLVRSTVRMVDREGIPIVIRPHAEYFPERGIEEASLYEKSLWILDQMLFQHNVKTRMARVDSQTCKIVDLEETSIAHALASAANKASNPMLHWQTLIQIFQSLPSVGLSEYLLCLPGQDTHSATSSASIHAPISLSRGDSAERDTACIVNLENSISQAETVVLNQDALLYCSRDWKWTDRERVPYTFPPREKAKTNKQQ